MIEITVTDAGMEAITSHKSLSLTGFIAGSSPYLTDMQTWYSDPSQYTGSYVFQTYPVNYTKIYIKGKTYIIDGKTVTVDYNALVAVGSLDTSLASKRYDMRSIGLVATPEDDGISFIYAFGTLQSGSSPYPVSPRDSITYITPVKVFFDQLPKLTYTETAVPWTDFIGHTQNSSGDSTTKDNPPHGLYIDKTEKKLFVDGTEIQLGASAEMEARISAIENTYVKYKAPEETIEYNSEWVSRMTGTGTAGDPYRIYTPRDFNDIRNHPDCNYVIENNLDFSSCIGITAIYSGQGTITKTITDPTAPLYNDGQGFEPILYGDSTSSSRITTTINGQNHILKGIYTSFVHENACSILKNQSNGYNSAIITGLQIIDTVIDASGANYGMLFGGGTNSYGFDSISYCVSKATVCGKYNGDILGIGRNDYFENCHFGGILAAPSGGRGANAYGIGQGGNCRNCYCSGTFDVSTTSNSYGIAPYPCYNCYSSSYLTGGTTYDITNHTTHDYCYCLEGCATKITSTPVTPTVMRSQEFIPLINQGLTSVAYEYVENGYPKLIFEDNPVAKTTPIAVLNSSREATPSEVKLVDLQNLAPVAMLNSKSSAFLAIGTILPSEWNSSGGTYPTYKDQQGVQSTSTLVLIPTQLSLDCGIYVEPYSGKLCFKRATKPTVDYPYTVLVIN